MRANNREDESDLRAHACDLRTEASKTIASAAIAPEFLVEIADEAEHELLRQELRSAPIEMQVDAVGVLRLGVLEISGEAADSRKFAPCLRIVVGLAAAGIDAASGQAQRLIDLVQPTQQAHGRGSR